MEKDSLRERMLKGSRFKMLGGPSEAIKKIFLQNYRKVMSRVHRKEKKSKYFQVDKCKGTYSPPCLRRVKSSVPPPPPPPPRGKM